MTAPLNPCGRVRAAAPARGSASWASPMPGTRISAGLPRRRRAKSTPPPDRFAIEKGEALRRPSAYGCLVSSVHETIRARAERWR
jgi:hypothetical protein